MMQQDPYAAFSRPVGQSDPYAGIAAPVQGARPAAQPQRRAPSRQEGRQQTGAPTATAADERMFARAGGGYERDGTPTVSPIPGGEEAPTPHDYPGQYDYRTTGYVNTEEANDPNLLVLQGYSYDPQRQSWVRPGAPDAPAPAPAPAPKEPQTTPGYDLAMQQERDQQARYLEQGTNGYANPEFFDQLTAPINDEIAGGIGYLTQGAGNLLRQLQGRDIEVGARDRAGAMRDLSREGQRRFEGEHPGQAIGGGVLGGLLFAPGRVASAPGAVASFLRPTAGQAYGQAAGVGAAYGAADAEGGLLNRAVGAGTGAALSAATVGLLDPATYRGLRSGAAEAGARVQRGVGIQPRETPITERATRRAEQYVADLIESAGETPQGLLSRPATLAGKPITTAEAIGPTGVAQVTALTRRSGRTGALASDVLGQRADEQGARLMDDFTETLGINGATAQDTIAQVARQGREVASPLYRAAYEAQNVASPVLDGLMRRPSMKSAMQRAMQIAAEEGRAPNDIGLVTRRIARPGGGGYDEVVEVVTPSMQTWDYVKRGLDDVLETYRDPTTRRMNLDTQGRAAESTRQALRAELTNTKQPWGQAYADALQAGGDPIRLESAFNEGSRLLSSSVPERIFRDRVARMAEPERMALLAGYADNLNTLARSGRLRPRTLRNPALREKIGLLVGQDRAAQLMTRLGAEVSMAATGSRMAPGTNSTTAEAMEAMRQQDRGVGLLADFASNLETSPGPIAATTKTAVEALMAPLAGFVHGIQTPAPQPVRDEIGRLLMMAPDELVGLLGARRPRNGARLPAGVTAASEERSRGLLAQ